MKPYPNYKAQELKKHADKDFKCKNSEIFLAKFLH